MLDLKKQIWDTVIDAFKKGKLSKCKYKQGKENGILKVRKG